MVASSNVEKNPLFHPSVEMAPVIGFPRGVDGELPKAFVVLREGNIVSVEYFIQYVNGNWLP